MIRRSANSQQPLATPPSTHQTNHALTLITRRNLLLLLGGSIAALGTLQWLNQSAKRTSETSPDTALLTNAQHDNFLALSMLLTSHQHLNPQTSARIYNALSAQSPEFQQQAAALFQFTQKHQFQNVDIIVNSLNVELSPLKTVLHHIVAAWYLGVVGDIAHSQVTSFESALMFDPVRDIVGVPSFCSAAPGYWAEQPTAPTALKI